MKASRADIVVACMAREIEDGAVVATGVASPLAILAIAVARATHAPRLTYLACVGSLNPALPFLYRASEDLGFLDGRVGEVSIPDLFDHARRGRIDTVFFGAAEVDQHGQTNMSAAGSLENPSTKLPGVAGAATLRRWVKRPVLLLPKQSKRALVEKVQVATTRDPGRPVRLLTDLGMFRLDASGACLTALHPGVSPEEVAARTGFAYRIAEDLATTPIPDDETLACLRAIDATGLREELVG
jgi:glutaconate CoA-transferase subunit B